MRKLQFHSSALAVPAEVLDGEVVDRHPGGLADRKAAPTHVELDGLEARAGILAAVDVDLARAVLGIIVSEVEIGDEVAVRAERTARVHGDLLAGFLIRVDHVLDGVLASLVEDKRPSAASSPDFAET